MAFVSSVALWWIYFNRSAGYGSKVIASASTRPVGGSAYTYFHLPMVAGIIVTAVGDDLHDRTPAGPPSLSAAVLALAGRCCSWPATLLYKRALSGMLIPSHLGGHRGASGPAGPRTGRAAACDRKRGNPGDGRRRGLG